MAISNALTPKKKTFSAFMTSDAVKNKINQMIAGRDGGKFITSIISLVSNNPALAECDHSTILASALLGESLKLSASPQLGQFYLVPFKDTKNNRVVATFVLGYKGYIQLAIRSGQYKKLNILAIKEGELISRDPLNEEIVVDFMRGETEREKAKTIGYYAMFECVNSFRKTLYWSREKMIAHAQKYSKAYKTDIQKGWNMSFWSKNFDSMAYKTMLRQLISKWGIMSVDFQTAITNDSAFLEDVGSEPQYVDNETYVEAQTIAVDPEAEKLPPNDQFLEHDPFEGLQE